MTKLIVKEILKMNTIKNLWKNHSKKIIAGAVVVGATITACALIFCGCRKQAIEKYNLEGVIAE